jgi:hypothetical protein
MCKEDAVQAGLALVGTVARIEAFHYGKDLFKLASAETAWLDPRTTASFVGNAMYLPSLTAIQETISEHGSPNPFEGTAGARWYTLFKHLPIVDAGLELGEAINSCTGRTR